MNRLHKLLALVVLTPMLAACSPSPQKVCEHVTELAKNSAGEGEEPPTEDDMKKAIEKCVGELEKQKKELGDEKYKKMVKCSMEAKDMPGVVKCNEPEDKK